MSVASFLLTNDFRVTTLRHHFALSLGFPYAQIFVFEIYQLLREEPDALSYLKKV